MRVSNNLSICGLLLLLTGFCKYTQTHTRKEFSTQQTMPSGHRHTHTESDCHAANKKPRSVSIFIHLRVLLRVGTSFHCSWRAALADRRNTVGHCDLPSAF